MLKRDLSIWAGMKMPSSAWTVRSIVFISTSKAVIRSRSSSYVICSSASDHDLVTEFVRVVFYVREMEIEEVLECGKAFQGGEVCEGVNFFRRVDFRPTKNP